ncbi:MAG: hypothetical protein ACI92Z_000401 [Paracoccaceae bacterium]|jgi:hypothetical protein
MFDPALHGCRRCPGLFGDFIKPRTGVFLHESQDSPVGFCQLTQDVISSPIAKFTANFGTLCTSLMCEHQNTALSDVSTAFAIFDQYPRDVAQKALGKLRGRSSEEH